MARKKKLLAPWEDIILRVIAIYKLLHGLFFIAVGVGLIKLKHQNIPQILQDYVIQPLQLSPENKWVDWALEAASKVTPHWLQLAGDAVFVYAILFLCEGIGLYLRKQWAEYFVVIVTSSLLPIEIWTMTTNVTSPALYALGTVTTVISFTAIAIALGSIAYIQRRRSRRG